MAFPDLSFISLARALEVEAIEGGRPLNEFTFGPVYPQEEDDDSPILGRAVDDIEETLERIEAIRKFLIFARHAYKQRGLVYPFSCSAAGDSLEVLPGLRSLAERAAQLSEIARMTTGEPAKQFEEAGFRALHGLTGGWGICVGAKRREVGSAARAIDRFRQRLSSWERGSYCPDPSPRSTGDMGADGFMILGRGLGGPIVFYQAKNVELDFRSYPEELARMPEIIKDWFGREYYSYRRIIPFLALNTVLTLETKERIFRSRGDAGIHIVDAVDIMCHELGDGRHKVKRSKCQIF